jgi:hypothetical protein
MTNAPSKVAFPARRLLRCASYATSAYPLRRENMFALYAEPNEGGGQAAQIGKTEKEPQKPVRRRPGGAGEDTRNHPLLDRPLE